MKGASIDITNTPSSGTVTSYNNAGNYEFAFITNIVGTEIFLKDTVNRTYDDAGLIQIIKVPRYVNATVTDTLRCLPWNSQCGGILVFEVSDTLKLNAPIEAIDKGFIGGQGFTCNGNCFGVQPDYVRKSVIADVKGEGISTLPDSLRGGIGTIANGGGSCGGIGSDGTTDLWYMGGGGGGNFGTGGRGGKSGTFCTSQFPGGLGGRVLTYSNSLNKIFLAGGGGVGHHRNLITGPEFGTKGGGIVIIKANSIICNNKTIFAHALDVPFNYSNVGRSGGGAGGTVVLEVQSYTGTLNIDVKGGKGGNNTSVSSGWYKSGPGGGGGGGIVWVNQSTFPANLNVTLDGGLNGLITDLSDAWGATAGQAGGKATGLSLLQSNNHTFVLVSQATTISTNSPICEGDTLHLHSGPVPPSVGYSWSGPNGFISNVQNPTINSVTTSNGGIYNLEVIVQGCPGPITHSNVFVGTHPAPPLTANDTVCNGNPNPGLIAHGNHIKWFADSTLNTVLVNDSMYFSTIHTPGIYTFYAAQTDSVCLSIPSPAILDILPSPSPPGIYPQTICFGNTVNPFIATGIGIISWYSDSLLTNLIYTGHTFESAATLPGIYYYYATLYDTLYDCISPKKVVTLTITPHAFAIANSDTSICKNGIATLFVNAPPNSTFIWSNGPTTQQITVTPIAQTQYYVTVDNGCGTAKDSVTVTISPLPPITNNDTVCFGFPNPGLTAIGNSIKWYSDSALTNLLSVGMTYTPPATSAGTHTYWATQSNSICESYPKKASLEILPSPAPPSINLVTVCYGNPNSPFVAVGNGVIKWYSDSLLSDLIHTGPTFTSSETIGGIYYYYAVLFDSLHDCPSPKKVAKLTIVPTVFATASNDTSICKNGVATLFVSATINSTFLWSNSNTTQQISVTPTHQTIYYVTVDNGCGTAKDSVTVSISPLPPTATNDTVCFGLPNPGLTATGNSIKWYADSALVNLLFSGSTYIPIVSSVGTHIFWVTQTLNSCESYPEKVTLTILQTPAPPIITNLIVCHDSLISPFVATGNGVISWYSDSLFSNLIHTGNTYTSTETAVGVYHYYATVTAVNLCISQKKDVTLTILPPAFAIASNDTTVCAGEPVTLNVYASLYSSFLWSTGDTTQQITVNPTILTHFYVTVDNGCGVATDGVTIFVNPLPIAYAGKDTTICLGQNATLVASGGISYLWNHNAGNTSTVVVSPPDTTNYIVTVTDINGCKNTDDVNVNISNYPVAQITGDSLICEGNQASLTAYGGVHYLWNIGDTTAHITVSPSNTVIYYVTVTNSSNCKDSSNHEVVVHNTFHVVLATAEFGTDNPISITQGQLITFTVLPPNNYGLFNFYVNDALQQSSISKTFISASLENNNIVSVIAYDIGCPSTEDSITVIVKDLPNAFIPFGSDAANLLFAKGLYLTILNRWGQEIFKGTEGWNGEYKNQRVSPGTYYYTVELNKGTSYAKILTGSVNVVFK